MRRETPQSAVCYRHCVLFVFVATGSWVKVTWRLQFDAKRHWQRQRDRARCIAAIVPLQVLYYATTHARRDVRRSSEIA